MTRNGRKGKNKVRIFFSKSNQIAFHFKMGHKIKGIRERLKAIHDDRTQFSFSERLIDRRYDGFRERRETGSYIPEEEVIGRNDEKEEVLDLILNSPNTLEDIAVVSIVGMGGLGKTALAQSIYNHNRMANQFQLKLWVCVSEDYSVKMIIRKIIESATGKISDSSLQMDSLQKKLKSQIDGKKYLLVMDDVWSEKKEEWFSLKRLLMGGAMGSRILITTRSEQVAKTFETAFLYSLKYLDECNAWTLFQKITGLERPEEELCNSNLVQLGKEIMSRLKGVPLVIRIIGGLLKDKKSERFWLSFMDKELYQVMEHGKNDIEEMRLILELSYKYLRADLKQCFLYCALFPKDYKIKKDELILQWRAQGFIRTNDKDELIDLGEDYFMELLSMSFFQEVTKDELGNIKTCKMRDLMHDLACSITENECVHGVGNNINKRTHHFSMDSRSSRELFKKLPKTLSKARNLRTFFMHDSSYAWGPDLEKVVQNHLRLRTLCCLNFNLWSKYSNTKFLELISKMKYLRYLSISNLCIKHLPDSITKLYNLETFILQYSNSLENLPSGMKNLVNLKYFNLSWSGNLEYLPNTITELCKLEALIIRGCKKLKELPGDVKTWINLKHLDLSKNESIEFVPDSITKLCKLETLILRGCKKLKQLPGDIKNLINLKHLDLSMNESIEFLPDSITELCKLEALILEQCKKLKGLPGDVKNWVSLKHLDLTLNRNIEFLPDSITQLNNFETLILCYCSKLKELPKDTKKLINLKHLNLTHCWSLTHMPKGLGELTNLQTLSTFVLGGHDSGELSELNGLDKLRGDLSVRILKFCTSVDLQMKAKYLQLKWGLQNLVLEWEYTYDHEPTIDISDYDCERVMDCLQPHSNLQEICIYRYQGVKLCNWLSSNSLGCLIKISLQGCEKLQYLPRLDQFPFLKCLYLGDLPNIKVYWQR
ncbi:putative disease resistance protein RGA1 [Benincasa hispida]|uniref:putative disease resistance protein RGA1 n=1 Tax=Benincasa hispida TaxID=102211 RepID=UPI001900323D|nr:putative disease resistance protein RGA1 [Benincasa hispida]XP_038876821.1 putative disease resistance protein RGA1 [Benincasa hispida]XP_038876822.1 putative disease resistance protein RGA1 [Benincasa hispida]XP_038876823.1 putative disease resistance protein RGA1 [Benincasa hispida]XP_038876824.1 putative disease resistance protein RGA1 [Benincasa hispida]XP_038876825.1 putative disease resistance protein RGA1 [Benincasa hispida]XP_038876826.1 putative disease resistance protein RGA1 [Be